jgi:predicted AlkP superfamily pyrophosphatase or phosphodiesterase
MHEGKMGMRKMALLAFAPLMAAPLFAQTAPLAKPKLIVAISIDQLSSDVFNEYRPVVTGGLKRMMSGVVFPAGYQSHAATETCPGHSTILTGSRPARTGIIANDWQDPKLPRLLKDGKTTYDVYCVEKPGPAGSSAAKRVITHETLKVPTLGDRLKKLNPQSRTVGVSVKDRAAVTMAGHEAEATLWWDGSAFVTYDGGTVPFPNTLKARNAAITAAIAQPKTYAVPVQCQRKLMEQSLPFKTKDGKVEQLVLGKLEPRKAKDEPRWRVSPESDAATVDMAIAAFQQMKLGSRGATDVLAVSLSGLDLVGHARGTGGVEICAQLMGVDQSLARLFAVLDASGVPYLAMLTADHGGHDAPERNKLNAMPDEGRAAVALSAKVAGEALAKDFGLSESALVGRATFGDMYLADSVPVERRAEVLAAAVKYYRDQSRFVEGVLTRADIEAAPAPSGPPEDWPLVVRAKASYDPARSGDFFVMLKPGIHPAPVVTPGYIATHGSVWGYDRRVPILFWWKGAKPFEQPNGVETVDIMPTLASLVGLSVPSAEIDGRCLDVLAGEADNCAAR